MIAEREKKNNLIVDVGALTPTPRRYVGIQIGKRQAVQKDREYCPGLVVMGGDSCTECRGFESQHLILDGHFSHIFVVKIVMFFEKMKINEKEAGNGTFSYC